MWMSDDFKSFCARGQLLTITDYPIRDTCVLTCCRCADGTNQDSAGQTDTGHHPDAAQVKLLFAGAAKVASFD